MAKFDDTPAYKRAAKWDPKLQRLVYPPTKRQMRLIRDLARELSVEIPKVGSLDEAQALIAAMLKEKDGVCVSVGSVEKRLRNAVGKVPRTAAQIAELIGADEENVHRALARLELKGRVRREMSLAGWTWKR